MARPTALSPDRLKLALVRSTSGVIAADSTTLSDANFPVAGILDCRGFDTIFVGVEIDAGTNPTATIECLFRDEDAADGQRWKRLLLGAPPGVTLAALANETTGALASGLNLVELRVYGRKIYPRISAVTNATSTTALRILAMGGQPRQDGLLNRS